MSDDAMDRMRERQDEQAIREQQHDRAADMTPAARTRPVCYRCGGPIELGQTISTVPAPGGIGTRTCHSDERRCQQHLARFGGPSMDGTLSIPAVTILVRERPDDWVAGVVGSASGWEAAETPELAIARLVMRLGTAHHPECSRPFHTGPCRSPLRVDEPETPGEAYERRVQAVEAVLLRRNLELTYGEGWIRETAEALLAAADTGI